ncbi:hypothetical protein GCM10027521_12070 [Amycolatopsis cihanbeyliensis]
MAAALGLAGMMRLVASSAGLPEGAGWAGGLLTPPDYERDEDPASGEIPEIVLVSGDGGSGAVPTA